MISLIEIAFELQGKGLQKTFWLDGREGLALPQLGHSQVDVRVHNHKTTPDKLINDD